MASPQYGHINEELTEVTGSIDVQEEFKQMIELPVGCVITRICETATGIRISFRHFVKDKEDGTVEEAETEDAILYLIEEGSAVPKCLRGQNTVDVFTFAGKTMYAFLR